LRGWDTLNGEDEEAINVYAAMNSAALILTALPVIYICEFFLSARVNMIIAVVIHDGTVV
jgi:hypothetical protein